MENVKEYNCAKCGAQVWKGEHKEYILNCPPYCPHCGALLPLKSAKVTVEEKDLNSIEKNVIELASNLKYSYKSPYARKCDGYNFDTINKILCDDFLNKAKITKKKADSYDNILMYGIFGLIGVCFLAAIVFGCIAIFGNEPKTGIEIVKNEATGKYGIYNHDKDIQTVPFAYDTIVFDGYYRTYYLTRFLGGLRFKFGVTDSIGNITIPCEMDSFHVMGNDLSIMYRNGMQGVYHRDGHIIIPCENQYVFWEKKPQLSTRIPGDYVGNIIPVKRSANSGWDIYEISGKRISLNTYQEAIQTGTPDLIKVKNNGCYGLVNKKGEEVVKCNADWILRFQEGMSIVYISKPYSVYAIDTLGNKILFQSFPNDWSIWNWCSGFIAVKDKSNGKIGYYDKTGKQVISHKFEQVQDGNIWIDPSFHGDSARISYQGQIGYVFKDGTIKLDPK